MSIEKREAILKCPIEIELGPFYMEVEDPR